MYSYNVVLYILYYLFLYCIHEKIQPLHPYFLSFERNQMFILYTIRSSVLKLCIIWIILRIWIDINILAYEYNNVYIFLLLYSYYIVQYYKLYCTGYEYNTRQEPVWFVLHRIDRKLCCLESRVYTIAIKIKLIKRISKNFRNNCKACTSKPNKWYFRLNRRLNFTGKSGFIKWNTTTF